MTDNDTQHRAQKEYYRARVDNIKRQVTVFDILNYYDIPIRTENAEVQFPCPLHGDGRDQGFSARAYPDDDGQEGGSTYCWGCHKARDVIEWVKDKESVSFTQAMKVIEEAFSVTNVPNIYKFFDPSTTEGEGDDQVSKLDRELSEILEVKDLPTGSFNVIERKIGRLVEEKREALTRESALRLYYAFDSVKFDIEEGNMTVEQAQKVLSKLMSKIQQLAQK